jgi:hypothetical protein
LCLRKKDTRGEREREGDSTHLLQDTSLPFGLILPSSFVPNSFWLAEVYKHKLPSTVTTPPLGTLGAIPLAKENSKPKEICCFQH